MRRRGPEFDGTCTVLPTRSHTPHAPKPSHPSYRQRKARNCAVVTIDGKSHYLDPWQSPEGHEKYAAFIAEWQCNGGTLPDPVTDVGESPAPLTVSDLILAYFKFAQTHYVKHGAPTSEQGCIKQALRPVRRLYGSTPAAEFGPRALKNVRQAMIDAKRARKSINKDVHRIKRMVRWGVEEELVSPDVYQKLRAVAPLAKGKTTARETGKVPPVPDEHVSAVLPFLPPPVAAMVQLQLLAGARPPKVISMRPCDLTEGDGVWYYTPTVHKTEHFDREKCIVLGPKAIDILRPFLVPTPRRTASRRSRQWPGGTSGAESARPSPVYLVFAPEQYTSGRYTRHSYRVAVQRAGRKAKVPVWSPRQLRHTRATQIRAGVRHLGGREGGPRPHRHAGDRDLRRTRSQADC